MLSQITNKLSPAVIREKDGGELLVLGDRLKTKLAGELTSGRFSIFDCTVPPGGGPPRHFHLHEDELFIVKDGELEVWVEGQWHKLERDDIAFAPRGSIHTYRNSSGRPCRFWMLATPAGIESFFSRLDRECGESFPPDVKKVANLCQQHGIYLVPPGQAIDDK